MATRVARYAHKCNDQCMSESPEVAHWLEFDLADRMRKALRVSGVKAGEMADYLDVANGTVSTWINGRIVPSAQTLRLWAMRTGVPYAWLRDGETENPRPEPDGGLDVVRHPGLEPGTRWFRASEVGGEVISLPVREPLKHAS